jgi:hypothetical protein
MQYIICFLLLLRQIITAGSEKVIRHWAVNGEPLAAVPGGHTHTFSLAHNSHHKSKQYEVCCMLYHVVILQCE